MSKQPTVILCSLAGHICDLKPKERTPGNALKIFNEHELVSFWDVTETPWLRRLIEQLKDNGLIEWSDAAFPHWRYTLTDKGRKEIGCTPK